MTNKIAGRIKDLVEGKFDGNWAELARQAGLQRSTVQQIKKGADPRCSTALKIASALGISVEWLLTGKGPRQSKKHDKELERIAEKGFERAARRALDGPPFIDFMETLYRDVERHLALYFGERYARMPRMERTDFVVLLYKHLYWMGFERIEGEHATDVAALIRLLEQTKHQPHPWRRARGSGTQKSG